MKKLLALCLIVTLFLCSFSSCNLFSKIERFIPNEQIMSVEIKTTNYETGIDEITEKYVLTNEQSDEIKSLLNEITYAKRYNILKEKWTYFNDIQYIFTFETQKVCLSENHIYIYDNSDALFKHVEFNSSTANDYFEKINEVLALCNNFSIKGVNNAAKIEVTKYDIGEELGTVTLADESSVKHIVDNLNSLKLLKLEYTEPTAIEYELIFYNASGEIIKTIAIELGGWIDYHGSLHSVIGGELDIEYIAGLFQSKGEQDLQFEIRDRSKEESLPCDDALEKFYEDESNEYYFSAIKSQYVIVIYIDGASEDIVTALNTGRITVADLNEFGIEYYIKPKQ